MSAVGSLLLAALPGLLGLADGPGLAIFAKKALLVPVEGVQFVDDAVVLVRDGKIEAVGPALTTTVPEGYAVLDVGSRWIAPGMIDLHCHVASTNFFTNDLNDMVYLTNPGLRASTSVVPGSRSLLRGAAGGVTSVLYIPGSGTNIGGQGVLIKTAHEEYERMEIRNPGSLKLAQAGNPERWVLGPGRSFMNWNTRHTMKRGIAYARRWLEAERTGGPKPDKDVMFEVFRDLVAGVTQVSTHTQIYQIVLMTITMVRVELGLPVYIDHGSFDGYKTAELAAEKGVAAILGPRQIATTFDRIHPLAGPLRVDTGGRIAGMAAEYQARGHDRIGFNTDSPVIPLETLSLQAAMAVRYGFESSGLEHIRGLTIIPALAAGIDSRVGSIEPGKDADLLIVDGDPTDPRTTVSMAFIDGERVYDIEREQRRW